MNIKQIVNDARIGIAKFFLGNSVSNPSMGLFNWLYPGKWSRYDFLKQYKRYVYPIVTSIAENAAKANYRTYRQTSKGVIEVNNHEALQLLRKPNPIMSQFQFLEGHFTYMELVGESFWYLAKGKKTNKVREIYLLRPDLMEVSINTDDPRGLVNGYVMKKADGSKIPFDTDEILHFKLPNPTNPYRGMGVIEAARTYIQTEDFASDWTKNSIYNAGRPSGILGIKGTINEAQWEAIKRKFKDEYSGTDNAGKTLLLKDIDGLHYQKLGMELDGVALKDLKALSRDDIMIMWKMSKTMLGITDDVNRSNAKENRDVFNMNIIAPKIDRFLDHFNAFFMEPTYGKDVFLDYDDLYSVSEKEKQESYEVGYNKWLTTNDIRGEMGLEPLKGGDYLYMSIGMVPTIGDVPEEEIPEDKPEDTPEEPSAPETPREEPTEEPAPEEDEEEEVEDKRFEKKKGNKKGNKEVTKEDEPKTLGKGQAEIFRIELYSQVPAWSKKYKALLVKELKKLEKETLELNSGKGWKKKGVEQWIPDIEKFRKSILKILLPFTIEIMKAQSKPAADLVGSEDELEITDEIGNILTERITRWSESVGRTLEESIISSLSEGYTNGDSLAELKERLKKVYKDITTTRAELVARTETIYLSNKSALETYRQSHVVKGQQWITNPGCCDFCKELEGKIIGLNEYYKVLGEQIEDEHGHVMPVHYDNIDVPPLHPNCECTITPVY